MILMQLKIIIGFLKMGNYWSLFIFVFSIVKITNVQHKFFHYIDSNLRPLALEETALPTEHVTSKMSPNVY